MRGNNVLGAILVLRFKCVKFKNPKTLRADVRR